MENSLATSEGVEQADPQDLRSLDTPKDLTAEEV